MPEQWSEHDDEMYMAMLRGELPEAKPEDADITWSYADGVGKLRQMLAGKVISVNGDTWCDMIEANHSLAREALSHLRVTGFALLFGISVGALAVMLCR